MVGREAIFLLSPLFLLAAGGFALALPPLGAPPTVCPKPAIERADADLLRCDGAGESLRTRAWLVGQRLDVNQANAADLRRLPRIGQGLAERIVEERQTNGAFTSLDNVTRVKGMGPKTLERLRPLLVVNAGVAAP